MPLIQHLYDRDLMKVIIVYASNECISKRSQATTIHSELLHQHTFMVALVV